MKKQEVIQEALSILHDEDSHLSKEGHARFVALLTKEVDEDPPAGDAEPMTDARWHEYALAALGSFGKIGYSSDKGKREAVMSASEAAVSFAVIVADGLLAAAKERAK